MFEYLSGTPQLKELLFHLTIMVDFPHQLVQILQFAESLESVTFPADPIQVAHSAKRNMLQLHLVQMTHLSL